MWDSYDNMFTKKDFQKIFTFVKSTKESIITEQHCVTVYNYSPRAVETVTYWFKSNRMPNETKF